MDILVVFPSKMYPEVIGGAQIFTYRLIKNLIARSHSVKILTANGKSLKNLIREVEVISYPSRRRFSRLRTAVKLGLKREVLGDVDAILGVFVHSGLMCALLKSRLSVGYAVRLAGNDIDIFFHRSSFSRKEYLVSKVYMTLGVRYGADAVIALSRDMAMKAERLGVERRKIRVIYNPVDDFFFEFGDIVKDYNTIVYIGRFAPKKGLETLVRAFSIVRARNEKAKLVLVGSGPLRDKLEKMVYDYGLGGSVRFIGSVPYEKVPEYMSMGKVFVLPSLYEGLPNTLLQAMAMKRAVVATPVGGVPEFVVNQHSGLLVSPNDYRGLAEAILTLLSDRDLAERLGENAWRRVYSLRWSRIVSEYEDVLRAIASAYA